MVLIGLPGAGKSTVGPLLAARLRRPFVDLDARIEAETGRTVAEIFALEGEAGFRLQEHGAMMSALGGSPSVIAPGGGWAVQPGAMASARESADIIYMECAPEVSLARLGSAAGRPLLEGGDTLARLRALHQARHPHYLGADHRVDASPSDPDLVALRIAQMVVESSK